MKRVIGIVILMFGICTQMFAQEFTASVSKRNISTGERFRLTYTIRNRNIESLTLPKLSDFSVVGGPYQSTSTQIINGAVSSTSSIAYDLVANTPGNYLIGGAVMKSDGKSYTSNALEITVVKGTAQTPNNAPRQDPFNPFGNQTQKQETARTHSKDDLFVLTILNKNSAYPGEPITVTYKIYSQYPQINIEEIKFPDYKDAWINELKESGDKNFSREVYNGRNYNVAVLQKSLFIPQRAGDIDIKAVTARVLVQYTERSGNFWEDFFGGGKTKQQRIDVSGNPVTLKVKSFPENGKPSGFKGATGDFKMEVSMDKNSISVNDALNIKLKISGSGNLNLIDAPDVEFPNAFESYDPKSSEKITAKADGITGSKTFDYLLVARTPGEYKINPIAFSYFNPKTAQYQTVYSDTLYIEVKGDAAGGTVYNPEGNVTENLAEDIRYIKTESLKQNVFTGFFGSLVFVILFPLLVVLTMLLWLFRTKIWDFRNDTTRKKVREADSVAVKRLRKAAELQKSGNRTAFYEECYRTVIQYLQDSLDVELASLSGSKVGEALKKKNIREELGKEASEILSACEFSRFAPAGSGSELADFHTRCIQFITQMEERKS